MSQHTKAIRSPRVALVAITIIATSAASSLAATYTFIPSAGSTPAPAGTANWTDTASWVNTSGSTTGTLPGSADVAGSATGATTIVNIAVPTINDLRFANAVAGATVASPGGTAIPSTADATLDIQTGGTLTIQSTNGTANGGALFGRAQPSGGKLIVSGGTLNTGSTAAITNDVPANVVIGDLASATGAANSTFTVSAGTANIGNNLIVGNQFNATGGAATGTATQTGGAVNVAGAVQIGVNGIGTYSISAGSLNQNGTQADGAALGRDAFFVGRNANGSGTVTQSGSAAVKISNGLYIANNNNTTGSYTVSGGTLSIAGEIKVGASTNSTGTVAATNNVGTFRIVGNDALPITANRLTADTGNATLGFTVDDVSGTTLLSLTAGNGFGGEAIVSAAMKVDLDTASGFTPLSGSIYELLRATSLNALPTLVLDGDAFDASSLSIRTNSDGSQSLIATVPEPASMVTVLSAGLLMRTRRRAKA